MDAPTWCFRPAARTPRSCATALSAAVGRGREDPLPHMATSTVQPRLVRKAASARPTAADPPPSVRPTRPRPSTRPGPTTPSAAGVPLWDRTSVFGRTSAAPAPAPAPCASWPDQLRPLPSHAATGGQPTVKQAEMPLLESSRPPAMMSRHPAGDDGQPRTRQGAELPLPAPGSPLPDHPPRGADPVHPRNSPRQRSGRPARFRTAHVPLPPHSAPPQGDARGPDGPHAPPGVRHRPPPAARADSDTGVGRMRMCDAFAEAGHEGLALHRARHVHGRRRVRLLRRPPPLPRPHGPEP